MHRVVEIPSHSSIATFILANHFCNSLAREIFIERFDGLPWPQGSISLPQEHETKLLLLSIAELEFKEPPSFAQHTNSSSTPSVAAA